MYISNCNYGPNNMLTFNTNNNNNNGNNQDSINNNNIQDIASTYHPFNLFNNIPNTIKPIINNINVNGINAKHNPTDAETNHNFISSNPSSFHMQDQNQIKMYPSHVYTSSPSFVTYNSNLGTNTGTNIMINPNNNLTQQVPLSYVVSNQHTIAPFATSYIPTQVSTSSNHFNSVLNSSIGNNNSNNNNDNYNGNSSQIPISNSRVDKKELSNTININSEIISTYKQFKRNNRACDTCREKKIKCGPLDPTIGKCNNCIKRKRPCTFNFHLILERNKQNKKKKLRDQMNSAAKRIERLTNKNVQTDKIEQNENLSSQLETKNNHLVDKLLRKLYLSNDIEFNCIGLLNDITSRTEVPNIDVEFAPKCKYKQYRTTLFSSNKLVWIACKIDSFKKKNKSNQEDSNSTLNDFYEPIKKHFNEISKWYMIQLKKLTNFDIFLKKDQNGNHMLFDLPEDIEKTNRILESLHFSLLFFITPIVTSEETDILVKKYYNKEDMEFPEIFLLNVSVLFGIQSFYVLHSKDSIQIRKDNHMPSIEYMEAIEKKLFSNCTYCYNKVMIHSSNIYVLKALLLWSKYISITLSNELGLDIFTKATYIIQALGLHKKSYYNGLSKKDFISAKGLWWYCISLDRLNATNLSMSPLIFYESTFPTYMSKEIFLSDLNTLLEYDNKKDEQMSNFEDAVDYAASHYEYFTLLITYYGSHVSKYEDEVMATCFSSQSILTSSFDQLLDKTLAINMSLLKWRENLHPAVRLETFKDYYKILSLQNTQQKPEFQFEVICCYIITYHFRYLTLLITLNLFIISLIDDNIANVANNSDAFARLRQIKKESIIKYTEYAHKILRTFCTLKSQPFIYRECLYFFYTAVFALMFKIIDRLNDKTAQLDNMVLLEVLHRPYHIMLEKEQNSKIRENMKWNAGYYIYVHLLKTITESTLNDDLYLNTFAQKSNIYEASLTLMTRVAKLAKEKAITELESADIDQTEFSEKSCKIFSGLTKFFIDFLKDENIPTADTIKKYMHHCSNKQCPQSNKKVPADCSIFTAQETEPEYTEERILKDFNENIGFLTYGTFFYDRDLFLSETLKDWNLI
ncbi:Zn(II)2Cys6 transcription factor PWA37_001027 [Arxiozyma heterogenica]|uniref:Zn(II)2Cys6 transcription factor n=1 Tax=Arxiozyma heterogenica TaxID=278026 RepID=UPI002F09C1A9